MGTLLDLASLVVVPSGYKEDIIYSVVPTDGSGDLDFTRASDATRVNSAGLVEKVRTNLLTYSQDLSNAAWAKFTYDGGALTVTGSQSDPFGGTNAQKLDITIGTGGVLVTQNITVDATAQYGISVWLKGAVGGEKVQFDLRNAGSNGVSGPIQTLTTTWTRYTITLTNNGGTSRGFQFRITTLQGATDCTFFAYGAQLEAGVTTDYIPTTTAAVSVGMTANVPRLDYLGSSCPSLLLEPQRTNLVTFSEQFDNAAYTKVGGAVVANNAISPDGYSNADTFTADGANSTHRFFQTLSATSGTAYTASFFVKKGTADFVQIAISGTPFGGTNFANFNISTGVVGTTGGNQVNNTITDYGNGWYRISSTITATATASAQVDLCIVQASTSARLQSWTSSASVIVYGCQLEEGSYPTSYIPTLGTSVTRVRDAASKTGITSLIGQTEGTLFVEFDLTQTPEINTIISISDGTFTSNFILVYKTNTNVLSARMRTAGVDQVLIDTGTLASGSYKLALAYKQDDIAFYVNGVLIGTDNLATIPATLSRLSISEIGIAVNGIFGRNAQTLVFKTRLSNTELAQLTTL
jgi:hypothetical protein